MPSEDNKVLESNQCRESDKTPSNVYPDLESLIKRRSRCKDNFEKSSTTKVDKIIPYEYSLSKIWKFDIIEIKKHDEYRGEDL